jgi:hypothetical protein
LEEVLLHNLWGEDLSQERIAQLRQSWIVLDTEAAYWQARCQEQDGLKQQMAALAAENARLRRRADCESDRAKAMALRSEANVLYKQYEALDQQRKQDGRGQAITVCVGVGGLRQTDRNAWNTYARRKPAHDDTHHTRMRQSTVARTVPPWRRLLERGWRLLWLPERPMRHKKVIDDIMAHIVIYLWQEEMVERETVVPWLQGYIRSVCRAIAQADVDYVREEALNTFTLPMHANSLRALMKDKLDQHWRDGGIDRRLVRGRVNSAGAPDERLGARKTSRRHPTQQRTSLTVLDAVHRLGVSPHTVRRGMRQRKIDATKKGKYWQLFPAALDMEERKRLRHELKNELIRLRVRWRSGGRAALGGEGAVHRAWDAARKWLEEQRKTQKTPGDVFALIADAPAIQKLLQQETDLLTKAQALLKRLGPDAVWE